MNFRFVPEALEQLEVADAWWATHRPSARVGFAKEIETAVRLLAERPELGRSYSRHGIAGARRYLVRRLSCHIYYMVRDEELLVLAIWGAQRGSGPPIPPPQ